MTEIRKPYNSRVRVQVGGFEESVTVQSETDDTNINNIVARFHRTGALPTNRESLAQYADVTNLQGKTLAELIEEQRATQAKIDAYLEEKAKKPVAEESTEDQKIHPEDTLNQNQATQPVQPSQSQETSQ